VHVRVYYNLHRCVTTCFVTWHPGGISSTIRLVSSWRYPALCHIRVLQIGLRLPKYRILIPVSSQTLARSPSRILGDFTHLGGATKCPDRSEVGFQRRYQMASVLESATSDRTKQPRRHYIVIILTTIDYRCMKFSAVVTTTRQSART